MAKIIMSPKAKQDLTEIGDYISLRLHNKAAAYNVIQHIRESVFSLRQFPEMGTPIMPVTNQSYRYLISGNYMILYHLFSGSVHIDRILYGRRDYVSILFGDELTDESDQL